MWNEQHTKRPVIERHSKDQVDARLQEAVGISEVFDFTFTAAEQWTNPRLTGLRTTALVDTDT